MPDHISLDMIDTDGAVREAAEDAGLSTRSDFFRKSLYAGGTLAAGGLLMGGMPALAAAKPSGKQDVRILNFALALEYLEAEFYARALAGGALSGRTRDLAKVIAKHERDHVAFLKEALGRKAVKSPTFDFGDTVQRGGQVPRDRVRAREHRRRGVPRPGRPHQEPRLSRRRRARSSPSRPATPARSPS